MAAEKEIGKGAKKPDIVFLNFENALFRFGMFMEYLEICTKNELNYAENVTSFFVGDCLKFIQDLQQAGVKVAILTNKYLTGNFKKLLQLKLKAMGVTPDAFVGLWDLNANREEKISREKFKKLVKNYGIPETDMAIEALLEMGLEGWSDVANVMVVGNTPRFLELASSISKERSSITRKNEEVASTTAVNINIISPDIEIADSEEQERKAFSKLKGELAKQWNLRLPQGGSFKYKLILGSSETLAFTEEFKPKVKEDELSQCSVKIKYPEIKVGQSYTTDDLEEFQYVLKVQETYRHRVAKSPVEPQETDVAQSAVGAGKSEVLQGEKVGRSPTVSDVTKFQDAVDKKPGRQR